MVTVSFLVEEEKVERLKNAVSAVYAGKYSEAFLIREKRYDNETSVFVDYVLSDFGYSAYERLKDRFIEDGESPSILYWTIK